MNFVFFQTRLKAEQALQSILIKFDTDVGTRASECDELDEQMIEAKRKFENFKATKWAQQELM